MRTDSFHDARAGHFQAGRLVRWEEEKGFGWIESNGARLFVHIKDFTDGKRRPKVGEEIWFLPGRDAKGRNCARHATSAKVASKPDGSGTAGSGGWVFLGALLILPGAALHLLPVPWWAVASGMVGISAITCGMYSHDKRMAIERKWRVPESSLHLAELLGGWPGAFMAQRKLRHKCRKASYQFVFWSIVLLYQFAAVDVLLEHRLSRQLAALVNQFLNDQPPSASNFGEPVRPKVRSYGDRERW